MNKTAIEQLNSLQYQQYRARRLECMQLMRKIVLLNTIKDFVLRIQQAGQHLMILGYSKRKHATDTKGLK